MREARSVLCVGARLGTDVRALHALGHFAVGIDLNLGESNPYVLPGDFHAVAFPDGSVDAVYTNALDHARSAGRCGRPAFQDMELLHTFEFTPNQGVVFVKTFNSWHSVQPMTGNGSEAMRRTLTINIEAEA